MSALLYVKASPRGERSRSIRVTDAFVAAWRKRHPDATVTTLDLFREDLPAFDCDKKRATSWPPRGTWNST